MAAVFGANFSELGRNLIADEAMRAQRTSDILRNLNATAQGLMASRDRRYATDAERERVAAQERLGRTQEANNLAIEQERNRLFGRQIDEQSAAAQRELDAATQRRRDTFNVSNARARELQSTYEQAEREASKADAATIDAQANVDEIAEKLKRKPGDAVLTQQLNEARIELRDAKAFASAARSTMASAQKEVLDIGSKTGFFLNRTGGKWSFQDPEGKMTFEGIKQPASGAASIGPQGQQPAQAPPIGVEIFGQAQGPQLPPQLPPQPPQAGPRIMPSPRASAAVGPEIFATPTPRSAPAFGVPSRVPQYQSTVPAFPSGGFGFTVPVPQGGVSAFSAEPPTATGRAIERGYFLPRVEPGGRTFFPNFEDVFPDGVSGGLREPAYAELPVFQFGATESDGVVFPQQVDLPRALGLPQNFDPRPEWQRLGY